MDSPELVFKEITETHNRWAVYHEAPTRLFIPVYLQQPSKNSWFFVKFLPTPRLLDWEIDSTIIDLYYGRIYSLLYKNAAHGLFIKLPKNLIHEVNVDCLISSPKNDKELEDTTETVFKSNELSVFLLDQYVQFIIIHNHRIQQGFVR